MSLKLSNPLSYADPNNEFNYDGLVLELTHDSPSHSNLIPIGEDKPIYRVTTDYPEGKHPLTVVVDSSGNFIASLEWRPVFADLVVFGDENGTPQKISRWMSCRIFKGEKVNFQDDQGRKYHWRGYTPWGDNPSASLKLYAEDSPDYPIVTYLCPPGMTKTSEVRPGGQRPKLILQPRAVEIQDLAVVSWLFLEKARRVKMHVPLWF